MPSNCALISRFAMAKSSQLQRRKSVDTRVIREFQPIIDCHGKPSVTAPQIEELRKNRENYLSLYCSIANAIAKKTSKNGALPMPSPPEISRFADYLCSMAKLPDFPFYGDRVRLYLERRRQDSNKNPDAFFTCCKPIEAENFLTLFQEDLTVLLDKVACISYLDGRQEHHVLFHAVFALRLAFQDYLRHSQFADKVFSTSMAHNDGS